MTNAMEPERTEISSAKFTRSKKSSRFFCAASFLHNRQQRALSSTEAVSLLLFRVGKKVFGLFPERCRRSLTHGEIGVTAEGAPRRARCRQLPWRHGADAEPRPAPRHRAGRAGSSPPISSSFSPPDSRLRCSSTASKPYATPRRAERLEARPSRRQAVHRTMPVHFSGYIHQDDGNVVFILDVEHHCSTPKIANP